MHTPGLGPSSSLATHSPSLAQRAQVWVVLPQMGFTPEQNAFVVHSKQLPLIRSHAGAAVLLAMHRASVVHWTHLFAVQMGFVTSLQSAATRHSTQLPAGAQKRPLALPTQLALGVPPSGAPQPTHCCLLAAQIGVVEAVSQPSAAVQCSQRPVPMSQTGLPAAAWPVQSAL